MYSDPTQISKFVKDDYLLDYFYLSLIDKTMIKGIRKIKKNAHLIDIPYFFIHGEEDKVVPPELSKYSVSYTHLDVYKRQALSYGGTEEIQFADPFLVENLGFVSKIPIIGDIFFKGFYPIVLFGILVYIIGSIFAYKTRFGLRMRACGENPQAADAAGVNVYKIRYAVSYTHLHLNWGIMGLDTSYFKSVS